jgi:hypothetical protein
LDQTQHSKLPQHEHSPLLSLSENQDKMILGVNG